jgi:TP901 family phage tail tape measure protein
MTTELGELRARLTLEARQFSQNMQQVRSQLSQTSGSTQQVSQSMEQAHNNMNQAGQAAQQLSNGMQQARGHMHHMGNATQSVNERFMALNMGLQTIGISSEQISKINEEIRRANPELLQQMLSDVRTELEGLGMDSQQIERITAEIERAERGVESFEESLARIQVASAAVGTAVVGAIGVSVKTAADFEAQMSRVKAISGATDEEFKNLEKSALDLGASTSKSASEVAIAFEDMAAKGFNATQIMEAMPGVIAAAEASGSDLALTADVISSALNGFQMEAAEASRVADILAKTANISAASMDDMGYAFKYVAPVANSLGRSIEEVSAAIGIMTNSGLDGSSAGTALRAALLALNNPAKEQEKIMKELGFSLKDGSGNAKSLSQMFADLTESTKHMTQAEKVATIAKLVGTEASSGMISVMEGGVDQLNEFTKSLKDSAGASKDAAKIMKDNLTGAVDEFKGAVETVGIEIGKEFLPVLTDIVKKGAEVIGSFDSMDKANLKGALAFGGTAAAVGLVVSSIGKLVIAARTLMTTMGPWGWLITGVSLLSGVIAGAVVQNRELNEAMLENIETQFKEVKSLDESIKKYDQLKNKSKLTTEEFGRFVDIQDQLSKTADPKIIEALTKEAEKLQEKSGLSNEELFEMVGLNDDLIEKVPQATKTITDQGLAILDNTEYIKNYNREQLNGLYDDLNLERIKTETQYKNLLEDETNLVEKRKTQEQELQDLIDKKDDAQAKANEATKDLNFMLEHRNLFTQQEISDQTMLEKLLRDEAAVAQQRVESQAAANQKTDEELDKTRDKLKKLEEVRIKMSQIILAQAGLTSEAGKELETIDAEILKLEEKKKKLETTTPVAERNNAEYQEAVTAINDQIGRLETAKSRVEEITLAAEDLNAELGKQIRKEVLIRTVGGQSLKRMPDLEYHTGGIVGRGQMPQLHTGGLASQFADLPSHNEIDVRLLRNEAVFTEAQQANLFRMIDAGFTNQGNESKNNTEPRQSEKQPVILQIVTPDKRVFAEWIVDDVTEVQEFNLARELGFEGR